MIYAFVSCVFPLQTQSSTFVQPSLAFALNGSANGCSIGLRRACHKRSFLSRSLPCFYASSADDDDGVDDRGAFETRSNDDIASGDCIGDGPVPTTATTAAATTTTGIRFLGKGQRAIVRPGVVLIAPTNEYHHYYRQAAIFIYAMGEDEHGVYVVRGVIVDHPTPFTLAEMMPETIKNNNVKNSPLGDNLMFRGGDKGGDGVILLHNKEQLGQSLIGLSGIYQGGWDAAIAACTAGDAIADDFKVFFNFCEFTELEIEDLLKSTEDGDCWASVEVTSDLILNGDWDRGDCWRKLRNAISLQMRA